jgi:cysteine desulfurase
LNAYFDHNATSPLRPEALEAMRPYLAQWTGNAASAHSHGQRAAAAADRARRVLRDLAGGIDGDVVFVGSGTEAVVTGVVGGCRAGAGKGRHLVVSAIEHAAGRAAERVLEAEGWEITRTPPCGESGCVSVEDIEREIRPETVMVSLLHANNETGVLQPVDEVGARCRRLGVLFHTDAVQSAGKVPLHADAWSADLVSLAAHKLGGPQGVGALWIRRGVRVEPLIPGTQEQGRRGGTVNVAGVVGFAAAAEAAMGSMSRSAAEIASLRMRLESRMLDRVPSARVTGGSSPRLPNTAHFTFDERVGADLVTALDLAGFAVSAGSACASGAETPSPVLLAMGFSAERARTAVRVSLGPGNTEAEVDAFVDVCAQRVGAAAERTSR